MPPDTDSLQNCANCRFSRPDIDREDAEEGDPLWCRRHAPRPIMRNDGPDTPTEWHWPQVMVDDWCGEWTEMWSVRDSE